MHHLVTLSDGPESLADHDDCRVVETFEFPDLDFDVAYVECGDDHDLDSLAAEDSVEEVDDADEETDYFLQLAPEEFEAQDDDPTLATLDDVRELHECPESDPDDTRQVDGENVTIAAMDSGVDSEHPMLDDVSIEQVDVSGSGEGDAVGHGTAVLGQSHQISPASDLISLRIFGEQGSTDGRTVMRAYQWAHEHSDRISILNGSWGASKPVSSIDRTHNALVSKGVVCVSAAGNSGSSGGSPATAERDFGVGACDERGQLAGFSSWDPEHDNPDTVCVGKNTRLLRASGTSMGTPLSSYWTRASGTSFSCPAQSGFIARYLSPDINPDATPRKVREDFEAHARPMENVDDARDGAGITDYGATVEQYMEEPEPEPEPEPPEEDEGNGDGSGDSGDGGNGGGEGNEPSPDEPEAPGQPERPERGERRRPSENPFLRDIRLEDIDETHLPDGQTARLSEYDFETVFVAWAKSVYGEDSVSRQHYFNETQRYCDVLIRAPLVTYAAELESRFSKVYEGIGQTSLYSQHDSRYVPLVVYPEGTDTQQPELDMMRRSMPIIEFPAPEGGWPEDASE